MYDCELPEFYSEKQYTARKEHKCCETGRLIKPGEKYWSCVMKFDGDMLTYKQSDEAYHFARRLNGREPPKEGIRYPVFDQYDECIPFGLINEFMEEHRLDWPELYQEWQDIKNEIF